MTELASPAMVVACLELKAHYEDTYPSFARAVNEKRQFDVWRAKVENTLYDTKVDDPDGWLVW